MKKILMKWLYLNNKEYFYDLLVTDFYGEIPDHVKEPSIEFLQNARPTLERFFSIQAYNIQRRSISDSKNAQIYQGFLLSIRTLLAVISKGKNDIKNEEKVALPDKENFQSKIEDFVKLGKQKK